jgi:hypothetical protein
MKRERAFEGETVSSVGNEVYARTDAAGNDGFGVGEKSPRSMALIAQHSPHRTHSLTPVALGRELARRSRVCPAGP